MEEIEEVVGDRTTVEADDLDKLIYMHQVSTYCHQYSSSSVAQVLEETLRLFPPANVNKATPPGGLKLHGYDLPAGIDTVVRCWN